MGTLSGPAVHAGPLSAWHGAARPPEPSMKPRLPLLALVLSTAACAAGPAAAAPAGFVALQPANCRPVADSAALPDEWAPYRAFVRDCPVARAGAKAPPALRLLAVFVDDYYRDKPPGAPWEDFPLPLLVDASGRCLARVAHQFPVEPPRDLVVRAGKWRRDGLPGEIRFDVKNPAVGGDYALPTLRWNSGAGTYQPADMVPTADKEKTQCP